MPAKSRSHHAGQLANTNANRIGAYVSAQKVAKNLWRAAPHVWVASNGAPHVGQQRNGVSHVGQPRNGGSHVGQLCNGASHIGQPRNGLGAWILGLDGQAFELVGCGLAFICVARLVRMTAIHALYQP